MKIYRNNEAVGSIGQHPLPLPPPPQYEPPQNRQQQAVLANRIRESVHAINQRIIEALEARQQATMGDIRRLSPPGLKEDIEPVEDDNKNWKGIIISLLVISTICSFILLSIVLLSPHMGELNKQEPLKLEDFIIDGFEERHYNGTWISNTELLYKEQNGTICIYDIESKHKELLLEGTLTHQYDVKRFTISPDHRYLLLEHDVKKLGHYSILAKYTVFDTRLHTFTPLRIKAEDSDLHQYAQWVPEHALIVVVHSNNIYVFTPLGNIQHILTQNGKEDLIFNGVPDMTYEEHLWNTNQGLWLHSYTGGWAMCYLTIDATEVERVPYMMYGKQINDTGSTSTGGIGGAVREAPYYQITDQDKLAFQHQQQQQQSQYNFGSNGGSTYNYATYPKLFAYPYPRAGKKIPKISLHVTKMNDRNEIVYKSQTVQPALEPSGGSGKTVPIALSELILSSEPVWLTEHEFLAIWSRRAQDMAIISRCTEQSTEWRCKRLTEQVQATRPVGSLMLNSQPLISLNKQNIEESRIFLRLPVSDGLAGTFDHIAMLTMDGKKQFLTHGQFVVSDIFAYREDLRRLFYAANSMEEPGSRHIYSLTHHNNSNERKIISCISCRVQPNASCQYSSARFSPNGRHFVLECMGPNFPTHYLMDTVTEQVIEVLDNSTALRQWASTRLMPKIRHYSIFNQNYFIRLQLIIPASVNELDDAKYPLVIETNRLPGEQSVNYLNKLDWSRYLTSRRMYITARVDTRGSSHQGDRHQYSIYRKVGELELEDLKLVLAYIKQLPYIDDSKIAVWGQEYGGYMATALLADNAVACGVAVSPITSWKNYLAIFSERYMSKPEDNYLGYEKSELMKYSSALKGKTLLVVHGTIDRRVNIQHTMQFMRSLIDNAVQYRSQLYPDSASLETWNLVVRYHFYRKMEEFFAQCFQVEEEEDEDDILPITKVIKGSSKQN